MVAAAHVGATRTCIDKERQALLDFKAPLQDPDNMLSTWRPEEEDDCCQWLGVTCNNQTGHVTELDLIGYGLGDNSFYGTIPREFGNLTNLEHLDLDSLGSCRVENLDWLSSLSSLAKANNWVNVIIGLQNLDRLRLVGCDLSHVMHPYSSSVNSSSSITNLSVQKNNLNSPMYSWLCPLFGKKLESLDISGNKFDGNLSDFLNTLSTSATTLESLDASNNQFTGSLSDEIQQFSFLRMLNLSLNQLNGTISDKLWQLPNLQELYLSSNSLTGAISENMLNLSQSIQYIDFSSNKLGPRFPKWTKKLKNLSYLDLSNNSISDTVSTEYWNEWKSSQLSYLDLSFNNISGKLPKSFLNHDLDFIDLSFNCFYGPIPAFPSRINFLDLSRNKFHGGLSFLCQPTQHSVRKDSSLIRIFGSTREVVFIQQ
ncbi:leucine-rich repeat-containing protein [Tanacetum coccineum]